MDPLLSIRRLSIITACLLGSGLAACTELSGPQYALRAGAFDPTIGPLVTMPDTVAASSTFDISVATTGDGCSKSGTTDVTIVDDFTAEIRPYDYAEVNPKICTLILNIYDHHATVQFAKAGIATVRLIGQSGTGTSIITRTVVVR